VGRDAFRWTRLLEAPSNLAPLQQGWWIVVADRHSRLLCLPLPVVPPLRAQQKAGTVDVGRETHFSSGL